MFKRSLRLSSLILSLLLLLAPLQLRHAAADTQFAVSELGKYGNLVLNTSGTEFFSLGYAYGDVIEAEINGSVFEMPVCSSYTDVPSGSPVCRVEIEPASDTVILALNAGNLAEAANIGRKLALDVEPGYRWELSEDVRLPMNISIRLKLPGGYYEAWLAQQLVRSNLRTDYPHLSDAEFANFRAILTTGLGKNALYRSSSPANPEIGRNAYADAAARDAGIRTIVNLADSSIEYDGWEDSYCSGCSIAMLGLGVDFGSDHFCTGLAQGLRAIIAGDGPYLLHCNEGKDRAGFVSAVLECLMGASPEEVIADYMVSYRNYYGVEPGSNQYAVIAENNIKKTLETAFAVADFCSETVDPAAEAWEYLHHSLQLSENEIAALRAKLTADYT